MPQFAARNQAGAAARVGVGTHGVFSANAIAEMRAAGIAEIVTCNTIPHETNRIAVEFVVDLLAQGWSERQIIENYPGLTHEDILACLNYASEMIKSEKVYPVHP